jgi:hypothetical protein
MKTSTLVRNGVSTEMVELISRLVDLIPWPERRMAMGDIAVSLLDSKERVAEDVFGWNRDTVEMGINELRTGVTCVNELSARQKPKTEEKYPGMLKDIQEIMDPRSQAEPRLRTTLLYTNLTAQAVFNALHEKGWSEDELPTVRTISNILYRHNYRLRTVVKTKVQKKQKMSRKSSGTSGT